MRNIGFILRCSLLLACFIVSARYAVVKAQFYTTGADPFSVRWQQYSGDGYRWVGDSCVMPKMGFYAPYLDSLVVRGGRSLGESPRHIDILLHSRTSYGNGLVAWAPKRMELYMVAPQSADCVPWLQHLLIHEYRHVAQFYSLNKGFTRGLYYLFGEQSLGLVSGLFVPKWLLEGDAVATETALSHGGRGRMGSFIQEMRSVTLTDGFPKYDAAYNGSYRLRYPNYYHMGYYTIAYLRYKYGGDFFASVFEKCGKRCWTITPFNRELRHKAGKRKVALYNEAMEWWTELWRNQLSCIVPTSYRQWCVEQSDYADYHNPKLYAGCVVAYKESPECLSAFVRIEADGTEHVITVPSVRNETVFDVHDSLLLWTERVGHVRWENGARDAVMLYDMAKGCKRTILNDSFYSGVSFSPSGKSFAVVRTGIDARQSVDLYTLSGELLHRYDMPIDADVSSLSVLPDGDVLAVVVTVDGASVVRLSGGNNERSVILGKSYTNIRNICCADNGFFFTSDKSGVDNVYCYSWADGGVERVTSSSLGAEMSMVVGDSLLFSAYSRNGYRPCMTSAAMRATDTLSSATIDVADTLTAMEGGAIGMESLGSAATPLSGYSKWNLLNPHTWGVLRADASSSTIGPSASISSQNLLGNTVVEAGINWDKDDSDELLWVEASYIGLYPKLSLYATWGYEDYYYEGINDMESNGHRKVFEINYDDRNYKRKLRLSISQPLQWNRGAWRKGINPMVAAELHKSDGISYNVSRHIPTNIKGVSRVQTLQEGVLYNNKYVDVIYGMSAHLLRRTAFRDIGTRLGVSADVRYRHTPFGDDIGSCRAAQLNVYLPGVGRHHYISLSGAMQRKTIGEIKSDALGRMSYIFMDDMISMPRGYSKVSNSELNVLKCNYAMPLFCPDWSVGPLVYLKRVWAKFFYDTAKARLMPLSSFVDADYSCSSTGVELYFDTHWLRLPFPVSLGYRCTYRIDNNDATGSLLFNIAFK